MKRLIDKKYLVLIIVFIVLPFLVPSSYVRNLLVLAGIFALLALSTDLVLGYIGQLTLGQSAFFGVGAYASAIIAKELGIPFWISIIGAIVIAGVLGYFIGFISLRLRGGYFAITTLAFAQIMKLIANNWIELTRGPMGYTKIPSPSIFGLEIKSEIPYYFLTFIFVVLIIIIIKRLIDSPTGRAYLAIREQEDLARAVGIDVFRHKVQAFVISAMIAGLAGGLYAHYFRFISPDLLGIQYTSMALMMVFVGGRGSIPGVLIGAGIYTVLPETLRMAGTLRMSIFGVILLLCIMFMPGGIYRSIAGWIKRKSKKNGNIVQQTTVS